MSIWIAIWFLIALFILGTFGWTVLLLTKQTKAWKSYADKFKLNYTKPPSLLKSPTIGGEIDGFSVTIYSEEQVSPDNRGPRYRNVVLIGCPFSPATGGIIATPYFSPFVATLETPETFVPDFAGWNSSLLFRVQNADSLKEYMTQDRLKLLHSFMATKNAETLFIFNQQDSFLRLETADPLSDASKLESLVNKMLSIGKAMKP